MRLHKLVARFDAVGRAALGEPRGIELEPVDGYGPGLKQGVARKKIRDA